MVVYGRGAHRPKVYISWLLDPSLKCEHFWKTTSQHTPSHVFENKYFFFYKAIAINLSPNLKKNTITKSVE